MGSPARVSRFELGDGIVPPVRFAQVEAAELVVQRACVAHVNGRRTRRHLPSDRERGGLGGRVQGDRGLLIGATGINRDLMKLEVERIECDSPGGLGQRDLDRFDALKTSGCQVDIEGQVVVIGSDRRGQPLGAGWGTGEEAEESTAEPQCREDVETAFPQCRAVPFCT